MDYEDAEFVKYAKQRYVNLIKIARKAIRDVFKEPKPRLGEEARLIAALLTSSPPVYIWEDYVKHVQKERIKKIIDSGEKKDLILEAVKEELSEYQLMLNFESTKDKIIIKPKTFLGKDVWGIVNEALKTYGFEWISRDKESFWEK
ncbi:MAG: hypothetical protein ACETWM_04795 [Candidatus Lokiarchaeia archaeon]